MYVAKSEIVLPYDDTTQIIWVINNIEGDIDQRH